MLVICEDCAKKYNIDESKIKGNRARFTCNECGHIIIVDKSDLSRPLVHAAETEQQEESSSEPTIDLLKEMEAPLFSESAPSDESSDDSESSEEGPQSDSEVSVASKRGLPIPGYFLIGGIASFFFTSAGFAYILFQYSAVIDTQNQEFQFDMLITAILVMVVTWALSFVVLYSLGHILSKSVNNLVATIHKVNMGEREVTVAVKGPRELSDLAQLLSELTGKLR